MKNDDDRDYIYASFNDEEIEDSETSLSKYELFTYPADFTLEVLKSKWDKKEIEIPDWQRKYVWKLPQASQLIDSFLLGIPVPAIYLYSRVGKENLLVIDGQQRLITIFKYFDGTIKIGNKEQIFKIKIQSDSEWANKSFKDLNDDCQKKLKNCVLRAFIIKQLNENDNSSIYHVFQRLNTGGTFLSDQEIRNCLYFSPFSELLKTLNTHKEWRLIYGLKHQDKRYRDVELILRFFCLREQWTQYKKPMKIFLSEYMRNIKNTENIEEYERIFKNTTKQIIENLGENPFILKKSLNAALLDSVYVAFSTLEAPIPIDIQDRFRNLKTNDQFLSFITEHTTDIDKVKGRIKVAKKILFG